MKNATQSVSTRPYLIRALFEWCNDNAFTPYIAVKVDPNVQVPKEYVQNGEIVLNISLDATSGLQLGNEFIEFKARFGGAPRQIIVPVGQVIAIYARENGQGMAFPAPAASSEQHSGKDALQDVSTGPTSKPLTLMTNASGQGGAVTSEQNNADTGQKSPVSGEPTVKAVPASSQTPDLALDAPSQQAPAEPSDPSSSETTPPSDPPAPPPSNRPKLTRIK